MQRKRVKAKQHVQLELFPETMPNRYFQFELFPEHARPIPLQFVNSLQRKGIIAATHKKKNVRKIVANAYTMIESLQGIDLNALVNALRTEKELSVELLLGKAVKPIQRGKAEKRIIARALTTIVRAAQWKRTADAYRKFYAPSPAERVEKAQQQRHQGSIQQQ
jgi:hypothetical protein